MIAPGVLPLGHGTWRGLSALAILGVLQLQPLQAQDGAGLSGAPAPVETPSAASRSRAETMARDVSGAFDTFIEKGAVPGGDATPAAPGPVRAHDETAGDWLARTRRGYRDLIERLATPTAPNPVADAARREEILRQQRWKPPSGDATVVTVKPAEPTVEKPEVLPPLPSSTPSASEATAASTPAGEDWLQRTYREYLDDVVGRLASGKPTPDGAVSAPIVAGAPETPDDRAAAAAARRAAEASALADRMRPVAAEKAARATAEAERRALEASVNAGPQPQVSTEPKGRAPAPPAVASLPVAEATPATTPPLDPSAVTTAPETQVASTTPPAVEAADTATAEAARRVRDWQQKQERAAARQRELAANTVRPPAKSASAASPPPGAAGLGMAGAAATGQKEARRQANEARRAARDAAAAARRLRAEVATQRNATRAALVRGRKATPRTANVAGRGSTFALRRQRASYGLVARPAPVARPSLYAPRVLRASATSRNGFRVVHRRRR